MAPAPGRKPRPLDKDTLAELALAYVGRFSTTRSKLAAYLARKLRERGWAGERQPDLEALVERLARSGYVDDEAYALAKSRSLSARGYGSRRLRQSLKAAGVADEDSSAARALADEEAVEAALRFARRRRIGPFAVVPPDPKAREKAIAAMIRAGHSFDLARVLAEMEPGSEVDAEELSKRLGR